MKAAETWLDQDYLELKKEIDDSRPAIFEHRTLVEMIGMAFLLLTIIILGTGTHPPLTVRLVKPARRFVPGAPGPLLPVAPRGKASLSEVFASRHAACS